MPPVLSSHLVRGALAGTLASLLQACLGKAEERLFPLPPEENSNVAPRLMHRLAGHLGYNLSERAQWALGTPFHLGYGAGWGMLYAALRARHPLSPWAGGLAMGGLIYGITFSRWGVAVQTHTERTPEERSRRMEGVLLSVALGFGLLCAHLVEAGEPEATPAAPRP